MTRWRGAIGPARRTVEGHVIALGIAHQPEGLELAQHELELDDVDDLAITGCRESRLQKRMDGVAPARIELLERDPVAAARRVVPVDAILVVERAHRARALPIGDRREKALGRFAHLHGDSRRRGGLVLRHRAQRKTGEQQCDQQTHGKARNRLIPAMLPQRFPSCMTGD